MDLQLSRCKNGIMDVLKTDNLPSLSFFLNFFSQNPVRIHLLMNLAARGGKLKVTVREGKTK